MSGAPLPPELLSPPESLPLLHRLKAAPQGGGECREALDWARRLSALVSGREAHPASSLFLGGLWYAVDGLDEAHAIFQEDPSPEGSYWHGMLHRREGDFFNARYWFQRAGRLATLKFEGLQAVEFVNSCEAFERRSAPPRARDGEGVGECSGLLEWQVREWQRMMVLAWGPCPEPIWTPKP